MGDGERRRGAEGLSGRPGDPKGFDELASRRQFLGRAGTLAGFGALAAGLETAVRGPAPAAWAAQGEDAPEVEGKSGMVVHATRPLTGEFPPHMLDDRVTPTRHHFVRNNGLVPERALRKDPHGWNLTIDGEVHRPLTLTLDELRRLPPVSLPLVIECAGNGRAHFDPPVPGTPWRNGAVGCSEWTGVRLRDLLERAGPREGAVYTAHYGEDLPLGGEEPFSRGVPLEKALEEHTLVAFRMNGEDLDPLHGYPVRLVVPGWIGSCSQKWLTRVALLRHPHDSQKMTGYSYRVPSYPVVPGTRPPPGDMVVATALRIKSMVTHPNEGARLEPGERLAVRGHAWAGESRVARVLVSTDYGVRWVETRLSDPPNRYAWYRWETELALPGRGYYEIWARAFDDRGDAQPFRQPWNPRGYLGNVVHRVAVRVGV